jgi:hypothetical protein
MAVEIASVVVLRRYGMWCFDAVGACSFVTGALPVPRDATENLALEAAREMFRDASRVIADHTRNRYFF